MLCERGTNDRTDKSLAVQQAGGVGMVLCNPRPPTRSTPTSTRCRRSTSTRPPARRSRPTAATAEPTASLSAGVAEHGRGARGGAFSSPRSVPVQRRRPAQARHHGARRRRGRRGRPGRTTAATSATPSPAPRWRPRTSPASRRCCMSSTPTGRRCEVKSALMTTASTTDNAGQPIQTGRRATPFDLGAGEVTPAHGVRPGPGLRLRSRLAAVQLRHRGAPVHPARRRVRRRRHGRPERLQQSVDRHRRPGRHADGHPYGDERRRPARVLLAPATADGPGGPTGHTVQVTNPDGYSVSVSPSSFDIKPGQVA